MDKINKMKTKPRKLVENILASHHNGVEYDYQMTECTGECDYYCRCKKVIDVEIIATHGICQSFAKEIAKSYKLNEIQEYVIERILTLNKVWDVGNWDGNISPGYYGQEILGCSLDYRIREKCVKLIKEFMEYDDDKAVEEILMMEYGFLLDVLKNKKWSIIKIKKEDIVFKQTDYYLQKKVDIMEDYVDYELPLGIVVPIDSAFRLIDGYTRLAAYNKKQIKVIVGNEN